MRDELDKSFDLEQQILACWNITDDLQVLLEEVMENDQLTKDDIANVLLGLKTLYHMRFDKTFQTFEATHWNLCMLVKKETDEPGPGTPMFIYNSLLDRLEERFPSTDSEMLSSAKHPATLYIEKIDALLKQKAPVKKVLAKKKK